MTGHLRHPPIFISQTYFLSVSPFLFWFKLAADFGDTSRKEYLLFQPYAKLAPR